MNKNTIRLVIENTNRTTHLRVVRLFNLFIGKLPFV
jgi:hypothetical protein